jgi:hypothetical protein
MMTRKILTTSRIAKFYMVCFIILLIAISCSKRMPEFVELNQNVAMNPDYTSVTIPPNIAPLNFRINEKADGYLVRFHNPGGIDFIVHSKDGRVKIPMKKWRSLLSASVSKDFYM